MKSKFYVASLFFVLATLILTAAVGDLSRRKAMERQNS